MPEKLILSDCWAEYDQYKKDKGEDPSYFYPLDPYEINFLTAMILRHYPRYTEMAVILSIRYAGRLIHKDCNRNVFIKLVIANLLQREPLVIPDP